MQLELGKEQYVKYLEVVNSYGADFYKDIMSKSKYTTGDYAMIENNSNLQLGIRVWPSNGRQYYDWHRFEFDFSNVNEIRVTYCSYYSEDKKQVFTNPTPYSQIYDLIENHLQKTRDRLQKKQAGKVKEEFDMIAFSARIDNVIVEDKKDKILVDKTYKSNELVIKPKEKSFVHQLVVTRLTSKKDEFSIRLRGKWKFSEEELLKILNGFVSAMPLEKKKKKD